jgi:hypothetical protein
MKLYHIKTYIDVGEVVLIEFEQVVEHILLKVALSSEIISFNLAI